MPTATVTPGYVFSNNELVTYPKLNALGLPTVSVTIPSSIFPQNYLRNGNFYVPFWINPLGISSPIGTETFNAQYWSVNPSGAAVVYSQSSTVQNTHSLVSAQITGATSATTVNFSQTIPGDLSDTLNTTVSFSVWIYNNTGINLTPVLIISSANAYNNFTSVTQIASANLQTITATQWGYETATVNLTGLSNVNNGLKVTIQFPSGSLAAGTQSVNISQAMLVVGSTPVTYIDDFTLFPPVQEQAQSAIATMNGDMQVWQRQTSFTSLGAAGTTYTADRWKAVFAGSMSGRCTISRQSSSITGSIYYPDTEYCLRVAVTTAQASLAAGDSCIIAQAVEQQIARALYDNPSSVSLLLRSSITGTFCVSLRNNNGGTPNQSYIMECPITTANTWQRFTFSIPVMPTGTGTWGSSDTDYSYILSICPGSGSTLQGALGGWQSGNFVADSNQTNLFATNGATLDISLVQHQSGNLSTPFVWSPFDQSLLRCQRYYYKSYDYGTFPGATTNVSEWLGFNITSSSSVNFTKFPVQQRTDWAGAVSSLYSPGSGTSGKVLNTGTSADVTPTSISNPGMWGFVSVVSSAAFTAGNSIQFHVVSDVDF